jgi:hypothetical protein
MLQSGDVPAPEDSEAALWNVGICPTALYLAFYLSRPKSLDHVFRPDGTGLDMDFTYIKYINCSDEKCHDRRSVSVLSPRRPRFDPRSNDARFVVDSVA